MKIIYLRTSTEEQNPKNQLRDCLTLAGKDSKIYEEKQSAWKEKDRPIFESIKREIKSGKIKEIYVWDLDRLYRNRKKLIEFFEFCKMYKCQINSFRQQWLNQFNTIPEPFNEIMQDLMIQIMGWMGEEESKKKSQRVKIAYANHKGNKWGRKAISQNVENEIVELKKSKPNMSIREISDSVFYYDKNRNRKNVSKSFVHKTLIKFNLNNYSF